MNAKRADPGHRFPSQPMAVHEVSILTSMAISESSQDLRSEASTKEG